MNSNSIKIDQSWKAVIQREFEKPYFIELCNYLNQEKKADKTIYPPDPLIFKAFELTPFDKLKVVILGQDPYHNPGEAMGLSFSVPRGLRVPPSLRNIYKELLQDLQLPISNHGDLTSWAQQGVLLLNAMLTVEHKQAGSHKKIGWQEFTNAIIKAISDNKRGMVFLLWGKFAQSKAHLIDHTKHHILIAAHPSPLARNAYSGCNHFSKTNELLKEEGVSAIDWGLE